MNTLPAIVFENDQVVVVDKPCGHLSVPSRMGKADPRPVVGIQLQDYVKQPIFPVHRLDEETSGVLVFAKTKKAQSLLSQAFERHEVQKTYEAFTEAKTDPSPFRGATLKNNLVRGKKRSFEANHGQPAETFIKSVDAFKDQYLLWTLLPKTGRSHQLRVQLAMRGFPIVGDSLYGSLLGLPAELKLPELSRFENSIGLRAIQLEFANSSMRESLGLPPLFSTFSWKL
jgi:23S rRNA-/tRNA-specific pseudouridylate synthase